MSKSPFLHAVGETIRIDPQFPPEVVTERALGGFGAVYLVKDPDTGRESALKTPRADLDLGQAVLDAFAREANLWSRLPVSPGVVSVYRVIRHNEIPYVRMPKVQGAEGLGRSLETAIHELERQGRRLAFPSLLVLLSTPILTLAELEAESEPSFVHGDIKPSNLLLDRTDQGAPILRLADFGLARSTHLAALGHGARPGDLNYIAPEVFRWCLGFRQEAETTSDPLTSYLKISGNYGLEQTQENPFGTKAADIYSLGATMFHFVFGAPFQVFDAEASSLAMLRFDSLDFTRMRPDLPQSFVGMLRSCLSLESNERPGSFTALAALFDEIVEEFNRDGGDFQLARHSFTRDDPSTSPFLLRQGQKAPMEDYLVSHRDLSPEAARAVRLKLSEASNLRAAGLVAESHAVLEALHQELPGFPPVLHGIAHGFSLSNQPQRAFDFYLRCLFGYFEDSELMQADWEVVAGACSTLAQLAFYFGEEAHGDFFLKTAGAGVELQKEDARAFLALAMVECRFGEISRASDAIQKALRLDPGNSAARLWERAIGLASQPDPHSSLKQITEELSASERAGIETILNQIARG